jgi:hypothetical protein
MNYLKAYCNLIRKAEKRGYTKKKAKEQGIYVEGHHIFPISIFGKNKRIVYLTTREHYIAHCLLEKVCIKRYGLKNQKTYKMIWAHISMIGKNNFIENRYYNSHLYEAARLRISQIEISQETKKKMSNHHKKSKWWNNGQETKFCEKCPSPEWKKGRPGINVGRKYSQETIEKMRTKATGRKHSQKVKEQNSIRNKNKIWWNNGIENKFSKKCPGPGWIKGRGFYWNNGQSNKMHIQCPGEGWVRGMIKNKNLTRP